ncbi:long-chain-fatty-acid--CoA ligase [Amorphus coralli]|uniref:long-chain-fatty-acid--CoA ligase n=1 Tax=Amorphus coralli TaxID=340680 RepID=UPI0003617FDC|nr:long-chain-fatty-acid--CoA ligase [Amorphus coralli]
MQGLMQEWPLVCHKIIDYAAAIHGARPVVSRSVEGPIRTTTYADIARRARQVAKRLERDGIRLGDRVATLAWNTERHLEVWYGLLGLGAIYHTVNPRLFREQIAWLINDAEDQIVFVDLTFVPILEAIAGELSTVERVVVLTDAAHMPETALPNAVAYEDWIAEVDADFRWADFDEGTAAGLCYTSGTTGHPKGVLYSHRSNMLHAMTVSGVDMMNIGCQDMVMPVVPMFHANGWGLPFAAPLNGSALVMPGPKMDGASIYEMLTRYGVTVTAAVPTVWLMLLAHLDEHGGALPDLRRVVIGGSACPRAITEAFQERYGVHVCHAWGMTEMSPLGTVCTVRPELGHLSEEETLRLQEKQGYPALTVEMKVTDDEGRDLPWDGTTFGRLKVRGPAVAREYYKGAGGEILDADGFFDTGDVATIDPYGYMEITDRSKDVIKSGGEWISSIELENVAVGHPDVAEAAVIGVGHPTWGERPLLIVVAKHGHAPDKAEIIDYMRDKVAKFWLPDDVVLVEEIPHTATGKIKKTALREQFGDYELPAEAARPVTL